MRIGKLNQLLGNISYDCRFTDSTLSPTPKISGNPAVGETLLLNWENIRDNFVSLIFTLPEPCFVDRITVAFGEKTHLTEVQLRRGTQTLSTHVAETGKTITAKEVTLEAGEVCDKLELSFCADFSNVEVLRVDFFGAMEDGVDIFPTPNHVTPGKEVIPAAAFRTCCVDSETAISAARLLCEKFLEKTGVTLSICEQGEIHFITDDSIPADGCIVDATAAGTEIRASNFRGFVYGAETFIKLTDAAGVKAARIEDAPAVPFRGVHLFIPSEEGMDYARRLVKYLISPMGYNTIIMQVSAGMIFDSHPNISAAYEDAVRKSKLGLCPAFPHNGIAEGKPISKALLREFLDYIKGFGIEVIPEVQSLGHVQYITHAYPEIAEIDENELLQAIDVRDEDKRPSQFYRHCFCPSNPRSYEILFDLLDEIIEVFQPKEYVHMGHDEIYQIGVCKICKTKSPADLLAEDLNKLHDYLAAKGLKMIIWSDMLQPVSKYLTPPAIDKIPKDILMMDFIWYFHLDKDIEENLLAKDFQVVYGNLYSSHFPRYESRIRKAGILGGQISAWTATTEKAMQQEGKLYDFVMTAQLLWSDDYRKEYTLVYDNMIRAFMPQLRDQLSGAVAPSRMPGAKHTLLLQNPDAAGVAAPVAPMAEFPISGRYDSLIFTHTALRNLTRLPWTAHTCVGKYILHYEDGTTEELPIYYSGNIGYRNRRQNQPVLHKAYRHTGYVATYYTDSITTRTKSGEITTLYRWEYLPKADKKILSVTLEQDPQYDANVYLATLEGITH